MCKRLLNATNTVSKGAYFYKIVMEYFEIVMHYFLVIKVSKKSGKNKKN